MEESKPSVVDLPRRLRAGDIPAAFGRIEELLKQGPVVVDFHAVEDFDASTLALVSYFRRCAPNITIRNVGENLERAFQAFLGGTPPPACEVPMPGFPTRVLHSLSDRFMSHTKGISKFFVMLADELFYTGSYLKKRRGVYPGEIWNQLFFMGYKSFPITCLLIFLIGVTVALTSAAQLKLYGADIYLADLIGFGMLRELVPLMTGIILAGKVGAAVAAELSTMTVLEEVDALQTMGVVPEKFLMVPRLLAITLAVPLLVTMADAFGIGAGVIVGRMSLGIPPSSFIREMRTAVGLGDFFIGLAKTLVFGWAVIVASGFKGLNVGRSAEEVGRATTDSVVLSVSLIILIDCIFAFIIY
jgi:phospholipid/cholesterol/gamma-HCH transport system permease protein